MDKQRPRRNCYSQPQSSSRDLQRPSTSRAHNILTQPTLPETCNNLEDSLEDHVNNVTRYILVIASSQKIIKRSELQRSVIGKTKCKFDDVIKNVSAKLKKIYGMNLIVCDSGKEYIISNALKHIDDPTESTPQDVPEDVHNILLLLVLSHIFMSNGSVTDVSLFKFLKLLRIDNEVRHELFGNINDCIKDFVKKQFLHLEVDNIHKQTYSWGQRAEKEISKHEVLKFVCKMYQNMSPEQWEGQYKAANEHGYDNPKVALITNQDDNQTDDMIE